MVAVLRLRGIFLTRGLKLNYIVLILINMLIWIYTIVGYLDFM